MNSLFSKVFFNQTIRFVIKKYLSGNISQDELGHSLYRHKYHHWIDVSSMTRSGFIELLIDKLKHPLYSKHISFDIKDAHLVCMRVSDITQFKKIYDLKKEIFTDVNHSNSLALNATIGENVEIVKMLLPQRVSETLILELMKNVFIQGNIEIFEHLYRIYKKENEKFDIYKWLDVFRNRALSAFYWVNLWIIDTSPDHKRIRAIFDNNSTSDADETVEDYLKKAIVNLGNPYWYSYLALGDPSLYFSCKKYFKDSLDWGSNHFRPNYLLNASFSDRLRMELMLTVYIYERYHNVEKTMESALLEVVNEIRKRHPDCQIDDHATGFEEHVFLLLARTPLNIGNYFSQLEGKLISAEYKLTTPDRHNQITDYLMKIFCLPADVISILLNEYPTLNTNSYDKIFLNPSVNVISVMVSMINGDVFNDHTESVLQELLDWYKKRPINFKMVDMPLLCKTPQSLRFVIKYYNQLETAKFRIKILDHNLHLLHPMFDNILEDFDHSVLFKLYFSKSTFYTDRMIDFRVTSIVSALEKSLKFKDRQASTLSIKQFLHFPKLLDYYESAPYSHIDYRLVGSIASYEIYMKLKDAVCNKKIILIDEWEDLVYESAMKYVEFSPLHKDFILKMNYKPSILVFNNFYKNINQINSLNDKFFS